MVALGLSEQLMINVMGLYYGMKIEETYVKVSLKMYVTRHMYLIYIEVILMKTMNNCIYILPRGCAARSLCSARP